MRFFCFIFLFLEVLSAFSITLNNGKENGKSYYIVHLENERPFKCEVKIGNVFYPPDTRHDGANSNKNREYHCFIEGKLTDKIADQHLAFMDMYIRPDEGGFWVIIAPKILSRLVPIEGHLYHSADTKQTISDKSTHYSIVIDEGTSIALASTRPELDFPIIFPNLVLPSIGALDFNKDPLIAIKEGDINDYITVKNFYEQGKYEDAIDISDQAVKEFPNSVFFSEFKLYIIRSLFAANALQNANNVSPKIDYNTRLLKEAKAWIKNFASDKNYPEVLYMLMQAYIDDENTGEATYILDQLMTEHEGSIWMRKALLNYADEMFANDKTFDAIRLYEDVLYMTDDVDIASLAALRLSASQLKLNRVDLARNFLAKVLDVNPSYLGKNLAQSLSLATLFKNREDNLSANKIYKIILENTSKKDDEYEIALRNLALNSSQDNEQTYEYLKNYQQTFPNSDYISLINTAIDRMFFSMDSNQTNAMLHKSYAELMEKYEGSDIAAKALKEEIKLYYKEEAYPQILALRDKIRDNNDSENHQILSLAALNLANKANQNKECARLMLLIDEYGIEKSIKDRHKLFDCYMRQARFDEALATTNAGVESGDLRERTEWLSSASGALYSLGRFDEALKAANDAIYEAGRFKYSDPSRAIYYRFYSLLRLGRVDEAMACIEDMKKLKGVHFMLIELYDAAAKYAAAKDMPSLALNYARKTLQMQAQLKINTYSPDIDFIYIDSLKKTGDEDEALRAVNYLVDKNLNGTERGFDGSKVLGGFSSNLSDESLSRALYILSDLELKRGLVSSSKEHVNLCISIGKQTPWKALCSELNELLEN